MMKRTNIQFKWLLLAAAIIGGGVGMTTAMNAQSWPNQCYNSDGGMSCPVCGGTCLGGNYLCCGTGVE